MPHPTVGDDRLEFRREEFPVPVDLLVNQRSSRFGAPALRHEMIVAVAYSRRGLDQRHFDEILMYVARPSAGHKPGGQQAWYEAYVGDRELEILQSLGHRLPIRESLVEGVQHDCEHRGLAARIEMVEQLRNGPVGVARKCQEFIAVDEQQPIAAGRLEDLVDPEHPVPGSREIACGSHNGDFQLAKILQLGCRIGHGTIVDDDEAVDAE